MQHFEYALDRIANFGLLVDGASSALIGNCKPPITHVNIVVNILLVRVAALLVYGESGVTSHDLLKSSGIESASNRSAKSMLLGPPSTEAVSCIVSVGINSRRKALSIVKVKPGYVRIALRQE